MEMQFLSGLSGFLTLRANGVFTPGTTGGDGSRPVIHMYGEQVGLAENEADPLRERGIVRVGKKAKVYAVADRSVARIDWSVAVGNAEPMPIVSMPEPNGVQRPD